MPSPGDLQFDNIDVQGTEISSRCRACGQEFNAEIKPGQPIDEVVQRLRDEFNRHACETVQ